MEIPAKRIAIWLPEVGELASARLKGIRSFFSGAHDYRCEIFVGSDLSGLDREEFDGAIQLGPPRDGQGFDLPPTVGVGWGCEGSVSTVRESSDATGALVAELFVRRRVAEAVFVRCGMRGEAELSASFSKALQASGVPHRDVQLEPGETVPLPSASGMHVGYFFASDLAAAYHFTRTEDRGNSLWVGRGDYPSFAAAVGLTGPEEAAKRIGFIAASCLAQHLGGQEPPELLEVAPIRLISRESTYRFAGCSSQVIRRALAYIRKNLAQSIGVDEVAQAAGVSRSVLQRRFRGILEMSVLNVIQWHRIERAKEVLSSDFEGMEMVAEEAGFTSAGQLNEVFKKWTGTTPSGYFDKLMEARQ